MPVPTRPPSRKRALFTNVYALGLVSFLTDVSSEMVFAVLPLFLSVVLGASSAVIGLIEGLADSTASLIEIASGYWSFRTGKKKELVVAGYGLSTIVKAGIAVSSQWWQLLVLRSAERVGKGIRTAPRDAILAASASSKNRGWVFGLHRAMDTAGAVVGPLLAWWLFKSLGESAAGFRAVFFSALVPAALAVIVILLLVREPKGAVVLGNKTPFFKALASLPAHFRKFLSISSVFSLSYFSFAFLLLRAYDLGFAAEDVLLLYAFYNVVYAVASVPVGVLSDRIGRKAVIAGSFVLYALVCAGFALASLPWHVLVLFALYGVFVAADESVSKAYVSDQVPARTRPLAFGAYNTAVGIAYLPASLALGGLWTAFGPAVAFGVAAVIALSSAAGFLAWV